MPARTVLMRLARSFAVVAASTALATGVGAWTSKGAVAQSSWAKALGPGTTVLAPPTHVNIGHGSPGAPLKGEVKAFDAKRLSGACPFVQPSVQAACRRSTATVTAAQVPTVSDFHIGYIAVDGRRALVGSTGTFCQPGDTPHCTTNHNPAAVLSSGKTFAELWAQANTANQKANSAYSLATTVKVGNKWYLYVQP